MFDREDNNYNNKAGTPKIVFKRPGSRDANSNGGFPGLNRTQQEKPQTADEQLPQSLITKQTSNVIMRPNNYELQRLASRDNMSQKALMPIRPPVELMSRDVDKEVANMQVQQRMRDLESMVIDLKGNLERRLQKIMEDQPAKFMSNFKRLEDKEGTFWKESNLKQSSIQDQYSQIRETIRKQNETTGEQMLELQRKVEEVSYQNHKLQKNQDQLQMYMNNKTTPLSQVLESQNIQNSNKRVATSQQSFDEQLQYLKDMFNQELKVRQSSFDDLNRNYLDLNKRLQQQEKDTIIRLQKQKDNILQETSVYKQSNSSIEAVKLDKLINDNDYLKQLIDQVERKLQVDMDNRLKQEFENRTYLEEKINVFKDEVRNDEKAIIEGEQKFIRQMNESISSIHQIIKFTKEELDANLASTQTLFAESVKSFGQQIEVMRETLETKVSLLERGYNEVNMNVNDTREQFNEHANAVQSQINQQNDVMKQHQEQTSNDIISLQSDIKSQIQNQSRLNDIWKDTFEKKNFAIFQEISLAMKGLKQEMQNDKKDSNNKIKDVREELNSFQQLNEKLISNVQEQIERNKESILFTISQNDQKQKESLVKAQAEINKVVRELDDGMFQRAKEFTQSKITSLQDKLSYDIGQLDEKSQRSLSKSVNQLQTQLQQCIDANDRNQDNKLRELREQMQYQDDEIEKKLEQFQKEFDNTTQIQKDELVQLQQNCNRELMKEIQYVNTTIDQKMDLLQKQGDIALKLGLIDLEKSIEDLQNKNIQDIADAKQQLIDQFRKELEDVVINKIIKEIQQEKNDRILKDKEIETSMHNIKNMILEALHQKIETANSLARALVKEEAAERAKNDEEIVNYMKDALLNLEKELRDYIDLSISECMEKLRQELQELEDKLNDFKEYMKQEIQNLQDQIDDINNDNETYKYMMELYQRIRQQELDETIEGIERQFVSVKQEIDHNLILLANETQSRSLEVERLDRNIDNHEDRIVDHEERLVDHENRLVDHEDRIVKQRQDHEALKEDLSTVTKSINNTIKKNRDEFLKFKDITTQNVEYLENEINDKTQEIESKIQLDNIMVQLQIENLLNANQSSDSQVELIRNKLSETIDQMNENQKQTEVFEEKTEKNFKVAEIAIKAHSNYINDLDVKLYYEELVSQLANQDLQNQQELLFQGMQQNAQNLSEGIEKALGGLQSESHNKFEDLEKLSLLTQDKVEKHAQQLEDHAEKLDNQQKQIILVETDIRATEEGINNKIEEVVGSVNENINQFNTETQGFKEEVNTRLNETNARIDDAITKTQQLELQQLATNERVDENFSKADEFANKNEELKKQFEEMNQKNIEINQKIDDFNVRSDEFAQKTEEADKRLAEALEKVETSDKRIEEMSQKIEEINQKQEVEIQKVESHETKIEELLEKEKNKEDSNKQGDDEDKDKAASNEQIEQLNNKIEELHGLIQEKDRAIEDLATDIHQQTERVDKLEEAAVNSQNKQDQSKQDDPNNSQSKDQSDRQKKVDQMEGEIEKIKKQLEQLEKDNKNKNNSNNNSNANNNSNNNASKDNKSQDLQEQLQQEIDQLKFNIEDLKALFEGLSQQVEQQKNQSDALGQGLEEIKEVDSRIREIESRLSSIESK